MFEMVLTFMKKAVSLGSTQTIGDRAKPGFADTELRSKVIFEEALEFIVACGFKLMHGSEAHGNAGNIWVERDPNREPNFVEAIDALCDLLYVVFGTFVAFGLHPKSFFDEVHRSNMTKLDQGVTVREDGKIMKSPSFDPPQLARVLDIEIKSAGRRAPLQGQHMRDVGGPLNSATHRRHGALPAATIPWHEAQYVYPVYCDLGGRGQSLERLCERGGFGIFEYLSFKQIADEMRDKPQELHDHDWMYQSFERISGELYKLNNEEIWKRLGPNVRVASER